MITFQTPVVTPYISGEYLSFSSSHSVAGTTHPAVGTDSVGTASNSESNYESRSGNSYTQSFAAGTFTGSTSSVLSSTYTSYTTTTTTRSEFFPVTTYVTFNTEIITGTNISTSTGTNLVPTTTTASYTFSHHTTTTVSDALIYTLQTTSSFTFSDAANVYATRIVIVPEFNLKTNDWLMICIPGTNISEWLDNTWDRSDIFFTTDGEVTIDVITGVTVLPQPGSSSANFTYTTITSSTRSGTMLTFGTGTTANTFYREEFLPMESNPYIFTYNTTATNTSGTSIISTTDSVFTTTTSISFLEQYLLTSSITSVGFGFTTYTQFGNGLAAQTLATLYTWTDSDGGIDSTLFTTSKEFVTGIGTNTGAGALETASLTFHVTFSDSISSVTIDETFYTNQGRTITNQVPLERGWQSSWFNPLISTFTPAYTGPVYMIQPEVSNPGSIFAGVSAERSMRYPGAFTTFHTGTGITFSGTSTVTTTTFGVTIGPGLFLSAAAGEATGGFSDNTFMGVRIPFQAIYPIAETWQSNTMFSSFTDDDSNTWRISWATDSAVLSVTLSSLTNIGTTIINSATSTYPLATITTFTNSLSPMGGVISPVMCGGSTRHLPFFSTDFIVSTAVSGVPEWTVGGGLHAGGTETAMFSGNFRYTNTDGTGTTSHWDLLNIPAETTAMNTAMISVFRELEAFAFFPPSTNTVFGLFANIYGFLWQYQKNEQWGFGEIRIVTTS